MIHSHSILKQPFGKLDSACRITRLQIILGDFTKNKRKLSAKGLINKIDKATQNPMRTEEVNKLIRLTASSVGPSTQRHINEVVGSWHSESQNETKMYSSLDSSQSLSAL